MRVGRDGAADDPAKLNVVTTVSPADQHRVERGRRPGRGAGPGARGGQLPHLRAAAERGPDARPGRRGVRQRPQARGSRPASWPPATSRPAPRWCELGDRTIRPDQYLYDFSFPREEGKPNPHLWTNPPYAKEYARIVRDTLVRRDPAHAGGYAANYERFAAKVDELDAAMKAATATVARRELLTYHDAYAYFAQHYGWKVIGAVQVSSFEEPTPREVAGLIQQVRQVGVPAIFGSEVFPSKVLAQIGTEAGVRYVDTLRDDDLPGRPGDPEHSWLGLMRFDFVTMVESLGGDASALKAVQVADVAPDRAVYPQ